MLRMKNKLFVILTIIFLFTGCTKSFLPSHGRQEITYHGKRYKILKAGDQYWMSENLATSTYRYGKKIPLITNYDIWPDMKTPGCGYYQNDTSELRKYGMLYNWYAVNGGKLCPARWRVPSHEDWNKLEEYLGGQFRSGGKMKAVSGWKGNHVSGDDIGFNALPGGYRLNNDFLEGFEAIWWSSTVADSRYFQKVEPDEPYRSLAASNKYIWGRKIVYDSSVFYSTLNLSENGFSVRCVKAKREARMEGPPVK